MVVRQVKAPKLPFGHKKLNTDAVNTSEQGSPIPPRVSLLAISDVDYFSSKCQKKFICPL